MKRRQFLSASAASAAAVLIAPRLRLFGADAPSNKLNVALLGTWGRGEAHFSALSSENVVALCDINEEHLAFGAKRFPNAGALAEALQRCALAHPWTPRSTAPTSLARTQR